MIPQLHDAVLSTIEINWVERVATLSFRRADGLVMAVVRSCLSVVAPRHEPWGPSSSVNEVSVSSPGDGRALLNIEMQSGDCLVFEGAPIEWSVPS